MVGNYSAGNPVLICERPPARPTFRQCRWWNGQVNSVQSADFSAKNPNEILVVEGNNSNVLGARSAESRRAKVRRLWTGHNY